MSVAKKRYLTKSRFKLALECPTKLYYTGKKKQYADQKIDDSFLKALADGGFQVGELAKAYFPGGHEIKESGYDDALRKTEAYFQEDSVVIYEAAIATDKLFIRADVLVKEGNHLKLYEVKAKSFDPQQHDLFLNKNGSISAEWRPYLSDVAFQKHVIKEALPGYNVSAHLMMVDKTAVSTVNGLNQKFRIKKGDKERRFVIVSDALSTEDLDSPILRSVNVDAHCELIYNEKNANNDSGLNFNQKVELYADHYSKDLKISSPVSKVCENCEFHIKDSDEDEGLKSGRKECWKENLGWKESDFNHSTVLDVWNFRRKQKLINDGVYKMCDLTEDDVSPKSDGKDGLSNSERQWKQVEKDQNNDSSYWIDHINLGEEMRSWKFPLHFIDFETAAVAIPFNEGRKPYEGIAFQFSHHTLNEDGTIEHSSEYLNISPGVFPNFEFIRALKAELEKDNGTIFRYADHENTVLNNIHRQIREEESALEDAEELCEFIRSISQSTKNSVEQWEGDRNMVDMMRIVKRFYYDPYTKGSNSIKDVLPAILKRSDLLQNKYSKPIYGSSEGITSWNFKDKIWIRNESDESFDPDPYKELPKMFQDVSDKNMELMCEEDELRDGGAAMTAYARAQYEEMSDYERSEIKKGLLKYCELDTLAMVMIYEGWKDLLEEVGK